MTKPGEWDLKPNDITIRAELGSKYGGNQQAGIAHSAVSPNIMVFSDPDSTDSAGYEHDGWIGTVYHYTGEGKYGDQNMTNGNKAVRDHATDGRALRVFVADGTDADQPYEVKRGRDLNGDMRNVFVFKMHPVGEVLRRPQDANAFTGINEVEPVGVHSVPTEATDKTTYEYRQVGTKTAVKREADLTDRFEVYLKDVHNHKVSRYRIATAGSSGNQFTDLADETSKILYEAKGVANRMSVRLAIGQVLDYGRYVKKHYPGTELSLLLPQSPPGDMIELLESLDIGCVVEQSAGVFVDETTLGRCP